MKRMVTGLMVVVLVVTLCGIARAETMAERKQRIMRKYLLERQDVAQSDIVLPQTDEENQRVADSERFQAAKVDISRKQAMAPAPAPMARPIPAPVQQSHWFLREDDPDADPYADPFALDTDTPETDASRSGLRELWQARQEQVAAEREAQQSTAGYGSRYGRTTSDGGLTGYGYSGQQQARGSGYASGQPSQSTYGQPPQSSQLGPYPSGSYGSAPSGMLQLPGASSGSGAPPAGSRSQQGYTPYQSPYQAQQEQRRQQQMYPPQQQPQPEYSKPTPYQQWKKDSQTWDPTADDAYLNDLMRRNRK